MLCTKQQTSQKEPDERILIRRLCPGAHSHTFYEYTRESFTATLMSTATAAMSRRRNRNGGKHQSGSEGLGKEMPLVTTALSNVGYLKKWRDAWASFSSFHIYCLPFPTANSVFISCWKNLLRCLSRKYSFPPTTLSLVWEDNSVDTSV